MSKVWRALLGAGVVAMTSCIPLPKENRPPPAGPPVTRGQSCVFGESCEAGLTCVHFVSTVGNQATCEIACDSGCPDGMTCGTRHDLISGDGAANVCL